MLLIVHDQPVINLVGKNNQLMRPGDFHNLFQQLPGIQRAGGIIGIDQHDRLGAGGDLTADIGKADSRRGLGLGLSLCKSIIDAHGGEISVSDNHPQGAVNCENGDIGILTFRCYILILADIRIKEKVPTTDLLFFKMKLEFLGVSVRTLSLRKNSNAGEYPKCATSQNGPAVRNRRYYLQPIYHPSLRHNCTSS